MGRETSWLGALEGVGNLVEAVVGNVETEVREADVGNVKVALREKVGEEWRGIWYGNLARRVRDFAAGLAAMGVEKGSRVALISTNRPEWPVADLAVMSLGAVTVPVYPTLEAAQVAHILEDSAAEAVLVEDEALLEKVRSARDDLPALREVILMDGEARDGARSFSEVEAAREPGEGWEEGWRSLGREDIATIIYTSGTTGTPKGVVLTHGNILSNIEGMLEALPLSGEDVFFSLLPLSHVFERTAGQFLALSLGATTYYAGSLQKVAEELAEVRPTVALSVPRLYEKMRDGVLAKLDTAPPSRKKVFEAAIADGRRAYALERDGKSAGPVLKAKLALYERFVFSKVREAVGGRLRFFVSGGARLDLEVGEFFYAAGIKIVEGYGLTETSPVIACNRLPTPRFGTVGLPLHHTEVRISDEGEVLVRGPGVMRGYLNDDEANAAAFTEDGFYRTGDLGEIDKAGCLKITARVKDLIVLSTGKNVAPQPVATAISSSPHVSQALVLGDGRKYVSALVVPDYDAARKTLGVGASDEVLAGDERTRDLVRRDLDSATTDFAAYERPERFELLPGELTQEANELTPTMKINSSDRARALRRSRREAVFLERCQVEVERWKRKKSFRATRKWWAACWSSPGRGFRSRS